MIQLKLTLVCAIAALLCACGATDTGSSSSSSGSSGSSGSGSSSSSSAAAAAACANAPYPGDKSTIQVYSFDAIAQLDICLYKATNDSRYVTDGNQQCKVLAGLIASTSSSFKPLYCSGSSLKL